MAIIRYLPVLLCLAAMVSAVPTPTKTASPNCVTGKPATTFPYPDGSFPITNYATVTPIPTHGSAIDKPTHYKLLAAWRNAHDIYGGHDDGLSNGTLSDPVDGYTAMKCQYKCNQDDRCVAFFVTNTYGGPCIFLDAIIDPALFVYDKYAQPMGGYNLLCNSPPSPFNPDGWQPPNKTVEARQDRGYKPDGSSQGASVESRQDRGYKPDGSSQRASVESRQDRGYKPDGSSPTDVAVVNSQDKLLKGDPLTQLLPHATHAPHPRRQTSDNCTEMHVVPTQSWVNYAPNADFVTKHGHYTFNNIETGDGAGFETTHRACHSICTGLTFCKSVFVEYIDSQWTCTIFDLDLTPDVYVQDNATVNTWPYGWNQKCPV